MRGGAHGISFQNTVLSRSIALATHEVINARINCWRWGENLWGKRTTIGQWQDKCFAMSSVVSFIRIYMLPTSKEWRRAVGENRLVESFSASVREFLTVLGGLKVAYEGIHAAWYLSLLNSLRACVLIQFRFLGPVFKLWELENFYFDLERLYLRTWKRVLYLQQSYCYKRTTSKNPRF